MSTESVPNEKRPGTESQRTVGAKDTLDRYTKSYSLLTEKQLDSLLGLQEDSEVVEESQASCDQIDEETDRIVSEWFAKLPGTKGATNDYETLGDLYFKWTSEN